MKTITALITALFFSTSCAPHPGGVPWQHTAKTEMLKICWDNDRALIEEVCPKPEYIKWDHTPVSVTSDTSLSFMVMQSVKGWNDVLGFEMFTYKELDEEADVVFMKGGQHPLYRGVTLFFKEEGRVRAGIFMFDSALTSTSTFLHEMGHAIGLRHDEKDTRSIMYPNNGRYFATVQAKDRRMLIDLYSPRN